MRHRVVAVYDRLLCVWLGGWLPGQLVAEQQRGDSLSPYRAAGGWTRLCPRCELAWLERVSYAWGRGADAVVYAADEGLKRIPGSVRLRVEKVKGLVSQGEIDVASAMCAEVDALPGSQAWAHLARAEVAYARDDWKGAWFYTHRAILDRDEENEADIFLSAAGVLVRAGRWNDETIALFERALDQTERPYARLVLSVLLEEEDPQRSEFHRCKSRSGWVGDDLGWKQELKRARTVVQMRSI